jgi:hypothetical protein
MSFDQTAMELRRIAANIHLIDSQVHAGSVDVTTSPQALGSALLKRGVFLQVAPDSIDRVWVVADASSVVGQGISLDAGDRNFFLPVSNLDQVWLVATVAVQVNYWAI